MKSARNSAASADIDSLCEYWGLTHPEVVGQLTCRERVKNGRPAPAWFINDVRSPNSKLLRRTWERDGTAISIIPASGIPVPASVKCDGYGVDRLVRASLVLRPPSDADGTPWLQVRKIEPLRTIPVGLCCFDAEKNLLLSETVFQTIVSEKSTEIRAQLKAADEKLETLKAAEREITQKHRTLTSDNERLQQQIDTAEAKVSSINDTLQQLIASAKGKLEVYRGLGLVPQDLEPVLEGASSTSHTVPSRSFAEDLLSDWRVLVSNIHAWLFASRDLVYERSTIETFLALLRTNDLVVLAGLPGSGKTHLVSNLAEAIGAEFRIVTVKPNWTSSDDLLGYYNSLERHYEATPFLKALIEASRYPERLFLICLDEMNLARVEYYFADFLSLLENRKSSPEIDLYPSSVRARLQREDVLEQVDLFSVPSSLKILPNVRFIGTVNVDETTQTISPKVLDRAFVLRFESALRIPIKEIRDQVGLYPGEGERILVKPADLPARTDYPRLVGDDDEGQPCITLQTWARDYLLDLGVDIGFRTFRQALHYYEQLRHVVPAEDAARRSLDDVLRMKVLPRLAFDGKLKARTDDKLKNGGREKRAIFEAFLHAVAAQLGECASVRDMRWMRHAAKGRDEEFHYWV